MKKTGNYSAFYALLKRMPGADKETLVRQYTDGRTVHLSEMSTVEYRAMIRRMQSEVQPDAAEAEKRLHARRSEVLHLLQRLGVDTTDWHAVDGYVMQPRIHPAAEPLRFARLSEEQLTALSLRLRMVLKKRVADTALSLDIRPARFGKNRLLN